MTRESTGERLARIETILEQMAKDEDAFRTEIRAAIKEMRDEQKAHLDKTNADVADLAALKNKGSGILIGVGLLAGGIGASIAASIDKLLALFK